MDIYIYPYIYFNLYISINTYLKKKYAIREIIHSHEIDFFGKFRDVELLFVTMSK